MTTFKQKMYNKVTLKNCAPGKGKYQTCFDRKALLRIVNSWNTKNKDDKINIDLNNQKLWEQINNRLKSKCNHEYCWVKQDFLTSHKEELTTYFKPEMPRKWIIEPRTWLNTTDIEKVMFQYQTAQPNFKFVGVVPIDFDYEYSAGKCVVDELCRLNVSHLYKKKINKLGVVFNLDAHDEPGSHWVALYGDLNKGEIYYYDSYGIFPPNEVKLLMERLSLQGKKIKGEPFKLYSNHIRHQFKNSECGVYSIHFITEFLNGKEYKQIIENRVSDDLMNKKRMDFYNKTV